MMKRIVRLGVVLSMCATAPWAFAESPWQSSGSGLNGSFLPSQEGYWTARRMQDAPQASDLDHGTLPAPDQSITPVESAATDGAAYGSGLANTSLMGSNFATGGYASASCGGGACQTGCCLPDSPCACCPWYGGVYGLVMAREDDFNTYLSFDSAAPFPPVMGTSNANFNDYRGGVESRVGYYLSDCWAVEGVYWGFYPGDQTATVTAADVGGNLASAIGYYGLSYNNGVRTEEVFFWYGTPDATAQMHSLTRGFEANNFEINFVRNPRRRLGCVHFEALAGVRYLNLDDRLRFSTDLTSRVLGDDPNNELHHVIDVENHLVGFQLGGRFNRTFFQCLGVHVGSKLGIYNNHVNHRQRLFGGNGNAFVTGTTEQFVMETEGDSVAFVGELFAGASYDIGCCWQLTGGYRAVSACGVAQSTSQFPRDREFASVVRSSQIDSGDCLLLHGAYFGVEYNW